MDCRMPGFPVLHHLSEFAQTVSIESVKPSFKSEEKLKSLLMKVKEESEKAGLKQVVLGTLVNHL